MTRVLIVEDEDDIASVLCRKLQAKGFAPEATADAGDAHRLLIAGGYDAAIIDLMLGEDSGLEILRALRRRGVQLLVIMLSALSRVEERAKGLATGANDYVGKPFELAELVTRLWVQVARAGDTSLHFVRLTL